MASKSQWKNKPRNEPYLHQVNGIVQPPVIKSPKRPGRRTNILDSLKTVLNAILRKRWVIYFKNPVDLKAWGVPDHQTLIKRPKCLIEIKKRLKNNYYYQASEAIEDITSIFENCMRFNKKGTVIHQAGEDLKTFFHKRLGMLDLTKEVEVETKPKPKAVKRKASEETPPQPRSKRMRTGIVPHIKKRSPPSMPKPLSKRLSMLDVTKEEIWL